MDNPERRTQPNEPYEQKHPCPTCGYAYPNPRGIRACPACIRRQWEAQMKLPEWFRFIAMGTTKDIH